MVTTLVLVLAVWSGQLVNAWEATTDWPSPTVVQAELTSQLDGDIIRPSDATYKLEILMKELQFTREPGAIVLVKSTADIQKCILFARKYYLRVAVRASGHSFVGRSTGQGILMIDVRNLNTITVNKPDPTSVTGASAIVGPGTVMKKLYEEVEKHNLLAVGGASHTVAVGGLTVGGGHSPMTRTLGLAVDQVLKITLVTAQGEIAEATESSTVVTDQGGQTRTINNADLFWAVRGGGAAFGVVTESKIKLHTPPPAFTSLTMFVPVKHSVVGNAAKDFLQFYKTFFTTKMSNKWGGYLLINNIPTEDRGMTSAGTLTLALLYYGGWQEAMGSGIKQLLDWQPERRLLFMGNHTTFWDWRKQSTDQVYVFLYIFNRFMHSNDFSDNLVNFLSDDLNDLPVGGGCTATHIGGKAAEIPSTSASVGDNMRSALWSLSCGVGWELGKEKETIQKANHFRDKLYTLGKGVYYNEPDYHLTNWQEEFWGAKYSRLQTIKDTWDPDNFFTCHMCVGTPASSDTCEALTCPCSLRPCPGGASSTSSNVFISLFFAKLVLYFLQMI